MVIIMKVIGIDPAPSKKTVIYNDIDGFTEIEADKLKKYLDDEFKNSEEDILICWDAPLTGGKPINFNQKIEKYNPFYQRKIEQLINATVQVKGISTMGYAGCPHWSITQYCLGLPQIFQPEVPQSNLPFQLITEQLTIKQKKSLKGKYVIEVHPALALWLWLKENNKAKTEFDWDYKENKETFNILVRQLLDKFEKPQAVTESTNQANAKYKVEVTVIKDENESVKEKTMTDDHLDAYIAWLLGTLWLKIENEVLLVGNKNTGAMLLPTDKKEEVSKKWQSELEEYK